MALYAVAGLSKQIELNVPLFQAIIPNNSFYNPFQRPGYPLRVSKPKWIQHETANENVGADALMHKNWLFGGPRDGDGNREWVSFHFVVDDHRIYQFLPVDEVSWQAADGDGPGNYECISCELCVNSGGDQAKARHNAEQLCGQIMKAVSQTVDAVGRHWDYNFLNAPAFRHHCPDHMMNDGYWPTFVTNAGKFISTSTGGGTVTVNYPQGFDEALCHMWFGDKFVGFGFDVKGSVSKVWLNEGYMCALDNHFKDSTTGREFFGFTNGKIIGRYAFGEAFRTLN